MTDRNRRFASKVIVITGAGSGIGRTAALAFAREGGSVVIGDINPTEGDVTARQILESGGFASAVRCDVRDPDEVSALIARAVADFGGVDVLYNNAGVVRYGTVEELSVEDWDFQLDINLKGTFLTCKYAIPEMRKRGGGAIVHVSSVQGLACQTQAAAYATSKGAVIALTRSMALDFAKDRIRVNAVCPGAVDTPMLRASAAKFAGGRAVDDVLREWGESHPLGKGYGRVCTAAEVAEVIVFLLSDRASFMTGAEIKVEGGLLARLGVALPE